MKFCLIFLLFLSTTCKGQGWQAEIMTGVTGYNGDLTQQAVLFKRMHPAFGFNIKYSSGDLIDLRGGIVYGRVSADDKDNKNADLKTRNLNFQSNILEFNLCAEFNLFDPELYPSFPYLFVGAGLFHFNPYTYDNDHKKTYLAPLSTEGEGLPEYPDRKKYSLTQVCLPIGAGWKINIKDKWEISYEFGYRILFTDYLDDVSKTYVDLEVLSIEKGPKSVEMAYRTQGIPFALQGQIRGNSKVKDRYFFSGLKLGVALGKNKDKEFRTNKNKKAKSW
jgi:Domain of unknown function (DUF6089)